MTQQIDLASVRDNRQIQNVQSVHDAGYQMQERKITMLYNLLEQHNKKRNVMTESEFSRYSVLYQQRSEDAHSLDDVETVVDLQKLSSEFFDKINPYEEITIVSDVDNNKVVAVLPKIYMEVQTLKEGYDTALSEFDNLTNVPFRRDLHEKGKIALMGGIAASQDILKDPSIREREMKKFVELDNALRQNVQNNTATSKNTTAKNNTESNSSVAGWEFDE